jgi:hypothetical protein
MTLASSSDGLVLVPGQYIRFEMELRQDFLRNFAKHGISSLSCTVLVNILIMLVTRACKT